MSFMLTSDTGGEFTAQKSSWRNVLLVIMTRWCFRQCFQDDNGSLRTFQTVTFSWQTSTFHFAYASKVQFWIRSSCLCWTFLGVELYCAVIYLHDTAHFSDIKCVCTHLVVCLEHVGPGGAALLVGGPLVLPCVLHGGSRGPPGCSVGLSRALLRRSLLRLRLRLCLRLLVLLRLVLHTHTKPVS